MPPTKDLIPYSEASTMQDPPGRVCIDADTHRLFLLLRKETGTGPHALLRGTKEDRPDGLDAAMVQRWLRGGAQTARKDHLDYVLGKWRGLTTEGAHKVAISEDTRGLLADHKNRTGVGPDRLLKSRGDLPQGLNAATVTHWLARRTVTARVAHLEYVLRLWALLPDCREIAAKPKPKPAAAQNPGWKFVPLTKEAVATLRRYRDATNLGPSRFMEKAKDPPVGLTYAMISNWLAHRNAKVRRDLLEYVLVEWRRMALESLGAVAARPDSQGGDE